MFLIFWTRRPPPLPQTEAQLQRTARGLSSRWPHSTAKKHCGTRILASLFEQGHDSRLPPREVNQKPTKITKQFLFFFSNPLSLPSLLPFP